MSRIGACRIRMREQEMYIMRNITVAVLLGIACLTAFAGYAVPPAYEGQYGNPEEPALRVVKWPWLGFRKMVMHTHNGLKCGIERHPPAAICEGIDGAAYGAYVLMDHTGRGIIYSKLPPKGPLRPGPSYEERALAYIEQQVYASKETKDLPGQPPNPPCSVSGTEPLTILEGGPFLMPKEKEPVVFNAQRRYVGKRTLQRDRALERRDNLLRYAR